MVAKIPSQIYKIKLVVYSKYYQLVPMFLAIDYYLFNITKNIGLQRKKEMASKSNLLFFQAHSLIFIQSLFQ